MKNLIRKILKEEENELDWVEEINLPTNVYLPWVDDGIKGLEEWKGHVYQEDDEIGNAIESIKRSPTKQNIKNAIRDITRWRGMSFQEGDDVDWALDYLKMSINPYTWKRFNVFEPENIKVRGSNPGPPYP